MKRYENASALVDEPDLRRVMRVRPAIWSGLVVALALLVLVLASQGWQVWQQSQSPMLVGTSLGRTPAPTFALVDQNGALIALSQLYGRPAVVTFLYTHCPGPCPLTAAKLHKAAEQMGDKADDVMWIAISLDPTGDTPEAVRSFVAAHQLADQLHFLLGSRAQLTPLWHAYAVMVQDANGVKTTAGPIEHSVGAFVLDGQGRERVYLDDTFAPATLASNLNQLLKS